MIFFKLHVRLLWLSFGLRSAVSRLGLRDVVLREFQCFVSCGDLLFSLGVCRLRGLRDRQPTASISLAPTLRHAIGERERIVLQNAISIKFIKVDDLLLVIPLRIMLVNSLQIRLI